MKLARAAHRTSVRALVIVITAVAGIAGLLIACSHIGEPLRRRRG